MNFKVELPQFKSNTYNVLDFGAKSDLSFNNQKSFQKAIDECNKNGGGRVIIPSGYYLTGPIRLKSNVCLVTSSDTFVQFTKSKEEYPLIFTDYEGIRRIRAISPITIDNEENVAIIGGGIFDGNGHLWRGVKHFKVTERQWNKMLKESEYVIKTKETEIWCPTKTYYDGVNMGEPDYNEKDVLERAREVYDVFRPVFVSIKNCNKVLLDGVTFQNSPAWNIHPLFTKNLTLDNCNIKNPAYAQNGDGIDVESCENVEIKNTNFSVGDDGICIKSGKNKEARSIKAPTKNVWIHDCKVFDAHGGFVVGSEMSRGVSNILVENCLFSGTEIGIRYKSAMGRGGVISDITMKNIVMSNITNEAFIFDMGYKLVNIEDTKEKEIEVSEEDIPYFKNLLMEDIICSHAKTAIKINGINKETISNLTFKNVSCTCNKALDLNNYSNIKLVNVLLNENGNVKKFDNEVLN